MPTSSMEATATTQWSTVAPRPVTADLASGFANGHGGDTLPRDGGPDRFSLARHRSRLRGSQHLPGRGRRRHPQGTAGDDHLDGSSGFDTLDGGEGTDDCVAGESQLDCEGSAVAGDERSSWVATRPSKALGPSGGRRRADAVRPIVPVAAAQHLLPAGPLRPGPGKAWPERGRFAIGFRIQLFCVTGRPRGHRAAHVSLFLIHDPARHPAAGSSTFPLLGPVSSSPGDRTSISGPRFV